MFEGKKIPIIKINRLLNEKWKAKDTHKIKTLKTNNYLQT